MSIPSALLYIRATCGTTSLVKRCALVPPPAFVSIRERGYTNYEKRIAMFSIKPSPFGKIWLHRSIVPSFHLYVVTSLHRYIFMSLHRYIVTSLHHYITISLHNHMIILLYYYIYIYCNRVYFLYDGSIIHSNHIPNNINNLPILAVQF